MTEDARRATRAEPPTFFRRALLAGLCAVAAGALAGTAGQAQVACPPVERPAPVIELVSATNRGQSAEGGSGTPAVNYDGGVVAFGSDALDLVEPWLADPRHLVYARVFADPPFNERVSVGREGSLPNRPSQLDGVAPSITGAGRFVVFSSSANNLVPDDTNDRTDVFAYDRQKKVTELISRGPDGPADGSSSFARINTEGREGQWVVVFQSLASNLVRGGENDTLATFVFDRESGAILPVSVASDGEPANAPSRTPAISGDGRVVAFISEATNLDATETNGLKQVFVHEIDTGITELVSVNAGGKAGNGHSFFPTLNLDGSVVAFKSEAFNLVPDDDNGYPDVFVYSRATGETKRVSVDSCGNESNDLSGGPAISGDEQGRFVTFVSFASNLDPRDGNNFSDVFVFDRHTREIARVSVEMPFSEAPGGDAADVPTTISADGRWIGFASAAANLVPNDINNEFDAFIACNPFYPDRCAPLPTPTPSTTPTSTSTATDTHTSTPTATATVRPSDTPTGTLTPTATLTFTSTPTASPTSTPSNTQTATYTLTFTPPITPTGTPSNTPTPTDTLTSTPPTAPTSTPSNTPTPTNAPESTLSTTQTREPTNSPTPTQSGSCTNDDDCQPGEVCVDNTCATPTPSGSDGGEGGGCSCRIDSGAVVVRAEDLMIALVPAILLWLRRRARGHRRVGG